MGFDWLLFQSPQKYLENNYRALDERKIFSPIPICCILLHDFFAFFLAVMYFGTTAALNSHLSSNKHLKYSISWYRTQSSDFKCFMKRQFISVYLLFCPKRGQRMERCLFFLQSATRTIKTSPAGALQGTEQEVAGL